MRSLGRLTAAALGLAACGGSSPPQARLRRARAAHAEPDGPSCDDVRPRQRQGRRATFPRRSADADRPEHRNLARRLRAAGAPLTASGATTAETAQTGGRILAAVQGLASPRGRVGALCPKLRPPVVEHCGLGPRTATDGTVQQKVWLEREPPHQRASSRPPARDRLRQRGRAGGPGHSSAARRGRSPSAPRI